jgi:hypothetical protein
LEKEDREFGMRETSVLFSRTAIIVSILLWSKLGFCFSHGLFYGCHLKLESSLNMHEYFHVDI